MPYAFYLGIDVTEGDEATLTLLEKTANDAHDEAVYHVREIRRARAEPEDKEEVGYAADDVAPALVDEVQTLLAEAPYTGRAVVVVNRTNARGYGLLVALTKRGLTPMGVDVTGGKGAAQEGTALERDGGDDAARDESSLFVAEEQLAGRLDRLQRTGRLKWDLHTEEASTLAHGLESYRAREDEADSAPDAEALGEAEHSGAALEDVEAENREAAEDVEAEDAAPRRRVQENPPHAEAHTSHVLSAALACWLGEEHAFDPTEHLGGPAPTTGEAKRQIRPDAASEQ